MLNTLKRVNGGIIAGVVILVCVQMNVRAEDAIVKNGSFEDWDNGKPSFWIVGPGEYAFDGAIKSDGERSLRIRSNKKSPNEVAQRITLKPNTDYTLELDLLQQSKGTFRVEVFPLGKDGKVLPPAVLVRSMWGGLNSGFVTRTIPFRTGDSTAYQLGCKLYASARFCNYIDHVRISPAEKKPDYGDQAMLYTQSPMRDFDPELLNPHAAVLESVSMVMTRNETEARAIVLYTGSRSWSQASLEVGSPLKSKDGAVIPVDNITIRTRDGVLLPEARPRDLPAKRFACWQVFVKSELALAPGTYQGTLNLKGEGITTKQIPLSVEIADIILPPAKVSFSIYDTARYYAPDFFKDADFDLPKYMSKLYADMAAHGLNTLTTYNNPHDPIAKSLDWDHNNKAHPHYFKGEKVDEKLRAYARRLYDFGMKEEIELAMAAGLVSKNHPIVWLPMLQGTYSFGGMPPVYLKPALEQMKAWGWPEILLYLVDEPTLPSRIEEAKMYYNRIKDAGIDVRITSAGAGPYNGDVYNLWIAGASGITLEWREAALESGREIGMYDCATHNTNPAFFRTFYGFAGFAEDVKLINAWTYYDAKDNFVFDNEKGALVDPKKNGVLSKVALSPEGPIPTVAWEAIREGTEDYRLAQYISDLNTSFKEDHQRLCDEVKPKLTSAQLATLRLVEYRRYVDKKVAPPSLWETSTPEEAKTIQKGLQMVYNERLMPIVNSLTFSLRRIPRNTIVTFGRDRESYVPSLGGVDPQVDAERLHRELISNIIRWQSMQNNRE